MIRWLAIAALLVVFVRHSSAHWIASVSGFTPQAVNYILAGLLEAFQWTALGLLLAWAFTWGAWRNLAIACCWIGISEGLQTAGCRVAIGPDISVVPRGANLCEHLLGLPPGRLFAAAMTVYLAALVVAFIAPRPRRET